MYVATCKIIQKSYLVQTKWLFSSYYNVEGGK
jgi:hypothetical protein